jgi:zinc transporter 7
MRTRFTQKLARTSTLLLIGLTLLTVLAHLVSHNDVSRLTLVYADTNTRVAASKPLHKEHHHTHEHHHKHHHHDHTHEPEHHHEHHHGHEHQHEDHHDHDHHHHHHDHEHSHYHKHGHDHDHHHHHDHTHSDSGHENAQYAISALHWLDALFPQDPAYAALTAVFYVSIAPIAVLVFIPHQTSITTLNTLVSFAVGSLLGDVFLHLLPHAFSPHTHDEEHHHHHHSHEHDHDHTQGIYIGLAVLAGFMAFFSVDRTMRLLGHEGHTHTHDHHHEHESTPVATSTSSEKRAVAADGLRQRKTAAAKSSPPSQTESKAEVLTASTSLRLSAYLNLLADATHNFTDGLAVAAAFYASRSLGITTTVACFFHEIPHEVGDYAILLRSGFGRLRAAFAQCMTALGAFAGALLGIWIKSGAVTYTSIANPSEIDLVMPFTAGGFVYVATVGVVPELLASRADVRQSLGQVIAMAVGVTLMALIAFSE